MSQLKHIFAFILICSVLSACSSNKGSDPSAENLKKSDKILSLKTFKYEVFDGHQTNIFQVVSWDVGSEKSILVQINNQERAIKYTIGQLSATVDVKSSWTNDQRKFFEERMSNPTVQMSYEFDGQLIQDFAEVNFRVETARCRTADYTKLVKNMPPEKRGGVLVVIPNLSFELFGSDLVTQNHDVHSGKLLAFVYDPKSSQWTDLAIVEGNSYPEQLSFLSVFDSEKIVSGSPQFYLSTSTQLIRCASAYASYYRWDMSRDIFRQLKIPYDSAVDNITSSGLDGSVWLEIGPKGTMRVFWSDRLWSDEKLSELRLKYLGSGFDL